VGSGDLDAREPFTAPKLLEFWAWREDEFLRKPEGRAIRRIGHPLRQRNLAVALGNVLQAAPSDAVERASRERLGNASPLLAEYIGGALRPRPD
jgi:epoxyqueuosine reductase